MWLHTAWILATFMVACLQGASYYNHWLGRRYARALERKDLGFREEVETLDRSLINPLCLTAQSCSRTLKRGMRRRPRKAKQKAAKSRQMVFRPYV